MFLYLCCPAASRRRLPLQRVDFLCAVGLSLSLGFQAVGIYHLLGAYLAKATVSERTCCGSHQSVVLSFGFLFALSQTTTLCLVVVVCCTDDAGMILRSHWALEFAFPSVLLSLLIFLSCFCFSNCTRIYTTTTTPPKGVGVGCVWFAIDLSFLDVVFSFFCRCYAISLSLSP